MNYPGFLAGCLLALIVANLLPTVAEAQRQRYPVPVGVEHPDFKLPNVVDGQPISLSDYRGKKVVLIHFASW